MPSRGKKKTTMAKLSRESRLRERRFEKEVRKQARKDAPPEEPSAELNHLDAFNASVLDRDRPPEAE